MRHDVCCVCLVEIELVINEVFVEPDITFIEIYNPAVSVDH